MSSNRDWLEEYNAAVNLGSIMTGRGSKLRAATSVHRAVRNWFYEWYTIELEGRGLYMAPAMRHATLQRITPRLGQPDREGYDLARGLCRDFTRHAINQVSVRLDNAANIFAHFTGETGSGKSSCSLWLGAEAGVYDQAVKSRGDLASRLCFEAWEVPGILRSVEARGCGWKDESPREAGVGSATAGKNLLNLEDTIRASQRSLHIASPQLEERTTTQITFNAVAQTSISRFQKEEVGHTMFLVERGKQHLGFAVMPWCSGTLFNWYQDAKQAYVEKALSAGKDGMGRLSGYLQLLAENRPRIFDHLRGEKKTDCIDLVSLAMLNYNLDTATVTQVGSIVYRLMQHLDRSKKLIADALMEFTDATGVPIPPAFAQAVEGAYVS